MILVNPVGLGVGIGLQLDEPLTEVVPMGQGVHDEAPAAEYLPNARNCKRHLREVVCGVPWVQFVHWATPVNGLDLPAGQPTQPDT